MALLEARCVPTEDTYALLLRPYCNTGSLYRAEGVISEMREHDISPSATVYNAYLDGLLKARCTEKAVDVYQRMKREFCRTNTETYALMINVYGKSKKPMAAMKVFNKMNSIGCKPNICTYTALVNAFAREGLCETPKHRHGNHVACPCRTPCRTRTRLRHGADTYPRRVGNSNREKKENQNPIRIGHGRGTYRTRRAGSIRPKMHNPAQNWLTLPPCLALPAGCCLTPELWTADAVLRSRRRRSARRQIRRSTATASSSSAAPAASSSSAAAAAPAASSSSPCAPDAAAAPAASSSSVAAADFFPGEQLSTAPAAAAGRRQIRRIDFHRNRRFLHCRRCRLLPW